MAYGDETTYKLPPISLSGSVTPEYGDQGYETLETMFWLLASSMSSELSVDGVETEFIRDNGPFFDAARRMGLTLERRIFGANFAGFVKNPIRVRACECSDFLPMLAVLAAANRCILSVSIDDAGMYGYCAGIRDLILAIGADATILSESLYVGASGPITGGEVASKGDYRLILGCALASCTAIDPITISQADTLTRVYPFFYAKLKYFARTKDVSEASEK